MEILGIKWKPELRSVSELKHWDKNPRTISEVAYSRLKNKIVDEGMHQVLTIDTDNSVLSGNQRLDILREVGVEQVWCMVPERALTEQERDKVGIQSNIIEGEWNTEILSKDFDIPMLLDQGFTKLQLGMNDLVEDNFNEEEELKHIATPLPKKGDVYELDGHRIGCLDATNIDEVKALMGEEKARLIFTDPPYMVDYHAPAGGSYKSEKYGDTKGAIMNDNLGDDAAREFFTKILKNMHEVTTDDVTIYWWFANKNNWINRLAWIDAGWKMSQILIWIKNSMVFTAGQDFHRQYEPCMFGWKEGKTHFRNKMYAKFRDVYNLDYGDFVEMFDVWYEKRDSFKDYVHPTQKPVRLCERSLKKHSEIGDIVLDFFSGSGSTLMACAQGKRRCFTMDLDPRYVEVSIRRYLKSYPEAKVKCLTRDVDMSQFK